MTVNTEARVVGSLLRPPSLALPPPRLTIGGILIFLAEFGWHDAGHIIEKARAARQAIPVPASALSDEW